MTIKIYPFNKYNNTGGAHLINELGGKGANLCEMFKIGIPTPPGFIIPTSICVEFLKLPNDEIQTYINNYAEEYIKPQLEDLKQSFGYMPLLSIRSGARVSMPGMLDTILNIGINKENLNQWGNRLGKKAALDCYRRFLEMYGEVVQELSPIIFKKSLASICKYKYGETEAPKSATEMGVPHLLKLIKKYEQYYSDNGIIVEQSLSTQIVSSILSVFKSWNNERAVAYRNMHGYSDDWGTAVVVQSMVYGNMDNKSCSGVIFSHNPNTGKRGLYGEFLPEAQGEDVVSGSTTPIQINKLIDWLKPAYVSLQKYVDILTKHYKDMQDIEFTVQSDELFILQTRAGKRSAEAKFKILYDAYYTDSTISLEEVRSKLTSKDYDNLTKLRVDPRYKTRATVTGLGSAGNVISGVLVFENTDISNKKFSGKTLIFASKETDQKHFLKICKTSGILTGTGGRTAHAAVVARGMNKVCVIGCSTLEFDTINSCIHHNSFVYYEGTNVTIDGNSGEVWLGVTVPLVKKSMTFEAKNIIDELLSTYGSDYLRKISYSRLLTQEDLKGVTCVSFDNLEDFDLKSLTHLNDITGSIILDIRQKLDFYDENDKYLLESLHIWETADSLYQNLEFLNLQGVTKKTQLQSKFTLFLSAGATNTILKLTAAGWQTVPILTKIKDIFNTRGFVSITKEVYDILGGEDTINGINKVTKDLRIITTMKEREVALSEILNVS